MATKRPKVLVVDDQHGMRMTLAGIIEDQGFDVTGASDGYKAIDAAKADDFDVIFMDMVMPGLDGVETYREIRKVSPDSIVVMMTGFAMDEIVADVLREGAHSVISKPFDPGTVVEIMETVMRSVVIVVLDDPSTDWQQLRSILEGKGFSVVKAESGAEAVRLGGERSNDVVLVDMQMTDMDAISAFRQIVAGDPDARLVHASDQPIADDDKPEWDKPSETLDVKEILEIVTKFSASEQK